jgi:hypothetical protein
LLNILKSVFSGSKKSLRRAAPKPRDQAFVAFITNVNDLYFVTPDETLESEQASVRLRVGLPARELARRVPVYLLPIDYIEKDPTLSGLGTPRAIVVGKPPVRFFTQKPDRATPLIDWVETTAREHRIVVDFSDDLAAAGEMYSVPGLMEFQRRLLRACPATVPSIALKERLAAYSNRGISVIEDPYESAQPGTPRFEPGRTLRLVWFGVFGPPLRAFIQSQFANIARRILNRPVDVAFVTYAGQADLVNELGSALGDINSQFRLRHVVWSREATASELAGCDLVVLPQDVRSDWGRVKSHNRLVEAIRAGRFAVVSPVPAYLELQNYAWVGDDLATGVEWTLENVDEVQRRLIAGQAYVEERFAPARIGATWADVLGIREATAA